MRQKEHVRRHEPAHDAVWDNDTGVWFGDWLPKEQWLADTCLAEMKRERKTLVYVKQTGERDIQPRLKAALESRGMRVGILKPSIAPKKRATWMKRHVSEFDVLLTNARLIEVGLNLTMFATGVFFEIEWSLYTMWQAMRRLYRPGAPKPVRMVFPVYKDTLAESALDLIGAKMMAAMTFYGDEVGGALVDEGDEGDLLNDLVRKALGQIQVGRAEGVFSMESDASPLGSPVAVSPVLRTFAELALRRRELMLERGRTRKAEASSHPEQMMLF